jgi:hypothetical protein
MPASAGPDGIFWHILWVCQALDVQVTAVCVLCYIPEIKLKINSFGLCHFTV